MENLIKQISRSNVHKVRISVVILTLNEERDLPKCLESLIGWANVFLVDSGSTDATIEVAKRYKDVVVTSNRFESFGKQRNWALESLPFHGEWVLFLDADEVATPEFRNAVDRAVGEAGDQVAGFYCCWKMMLEGRWLRRCDSYPKWQLRLLKRNRVRFTDYGHGQKEGAVSGHLLYLREPYLHFAFSKGWSAWIIRHNRYSSQEARARLNAKIDWRKIFSRHGSARNPAIKVLVTRVPGWPLVRFLHAYVLKLGFLEGIPGLIYCVNMSYYEFLIQIKLRELRQDRGLAS
jgi:glycosyltransferase involved in cell wall biosynthesis